MKIQLMAKGLALAAAACATIPALLEAAERAPFDAEPTPRLEVDRPRSKEGLRLRAQQLLNARRFADAEAAARGVLRRVPLDRPALRIVAMSEIAQDRELEAAELLIAASAVTWRDPFTQLYLYGLASRANEPMAAARRADALARNAEYRDDGFAGLAALLDRPGGVAAVASRLASRPPWRAAFFRQIKAGDRAGAIRIVQLTDALRGTAAPATEAEAAAMASALIASGNELMAYDAWRRGRPAAASGLLDDPDLAGAGVIDSEGVRPPFGWSFAPDTSVRATGRRDDAGRAAALVEAYEDRAPFFVSRLIPVAPGSYVLSYRASGPTDALARLRADFGCLRAELPAPDAERTTAANGESVRRVAFQVPRACGLLRVGFTLDAADATSTSTIAIRSVTLVPAD